MSKARPVIPNETLFSTRRVHKRQLLLKPSKTVNQLFEYVFAVLAERHDIQLHALTVLSNHRHDVATDPNAQIVEFQRECHSIISRYLNHHFGDAESLWSSEKTNRVTCEQPHDMIDKIAYTLANPVLSYLVMYGANWPGVRSAWPAAPKRVKQPPGFFRAVKDGGEWPEEATLTFHRPPGYDHLSDEALGALIKEATEAKEEKARREAKWFHISFLGRRTIRKQSRYSYPSSVARRFGLRPQVAAKSKWARIERLRRNKDWLVRYEQQLKRFREGERDVVFPFGTYKMRVLYGVECEPPPR